MYKTRLSSEEEFKSELAFFKVYFDQKKKSLSEGLHEIKKRIDDINDIVYNKRPLVLNQKGYSNLRPFEDSYQDAVDFFETEDGKRVADVFYYFAHIYLLK